MARRRKRKSKARRRGGAPKAAKAASKVRRKTGPRPGPRRSAGGAGLSLAELQRLVRQREQEVELLQRQRQRLLDELADVDAKIAQHTGDGKALPAPKTRGRAAASSGAAASGGRPRGSMRGKLPEMIREVLKASGEPMKLRDIAAGVLEAGYTTSSSKFGVIVGQRVAEMDDVKKVGHGVYALQ